MFRRFFSKFHYGKKGFTLIELLVVVAILGILAAVAIPNVAKFMGTGKQEAANTELANVQTAVMAAMGDNHLIEFPSAPVQFGKDSSNPNHWTDVDVVSGNSTLGDYVLGGVNKVSGYYDIDIAGNVKVH